MFREGELIRKAKDINIGKNQRNMFQNECYCKGNEVLHKNDTPFDSARRENLATTYFGTPQDRDYRLMMHTKPVDQALFMKTCRTVSKNLGKLRDLGDRNWSCYDIREDKHVSNIMMSKLANPNAAIVSLKQGNTLARSSSQQQIPLGATTGGASKVLPRINTRTSSNLVRVFSPQESRYIEKPAHIENESQKLTYYSMKNSKNTHSVQVVGNSCTTSGPPFEKTIKDYQTAKPYTVSAETFNSSWVDSARAQTTFNYESPNFNIINHGYANGKSIANLVKNNPKACYKVKSIAEYKDLTYVTAPKKNMDYQAVINKAPTCFTKATSLCSKQVDFGKTYGPFFSLFR